MERALSYTLGHKRKCCRVDGEGRVLHDGGTLPAIVHQYAKGAANAALKRHELQHAWLHHANAGLALQLRHEVMVVVHARNAAHAAAAVPPGYEACLPHERLLQAAR